MMKMLKYYFVLILSILILSPLNIYSSPQIVDWNFRGWLGNPDTIAIKLDSTRGIWNSSQIDSISTAIARWNSKCCRPSFRLARTTDTPKIFIYWEPALGMEDCGLCIVQSPGANWRGPIASARIGVKPSPRIYRLDAVVAHELGHALGLSHSPIATDCMFPAGNSSGLLSAVDSISVRCARRQSEFFNTHGTLPKSPSAISWLEFGFAISSAFLGEYCRVTYPLNSLYTPEEADIAIVNIDTDGDALVSFSGVRPLGLFLYFNVLYNPAHFIGQSLFKISITIPPATTPREEFMAYLPISAEATPLTPFTVWFTDSTSGGVLKLYWQNTYPITTAELNAVLRYDNYTQFCLGRGPFIIRNLPPGAHNFELFVDDFKGNSASYSRIITIVGIDESTQDVPRTPEIEAFPNPFNSSVRILILNVETRHASSPAKIEIFDINGRRVQGEIFDINGLSVVERNQNNCEFIWTPELSTPSGVYLIRAKVDDGKIAEKRIVFLK